MAEPLASGLTRCWIFGDGAALWRQEREEQQEELHEIIFRPAESLPQRS
jgi:hypothetical protein